VKTKICEVCEKKPAETKFRSIQVCYGCENLCEEVEREDRGTNLEDYEEYDDEGAIVQKKENPVEHGSNYNDSGLNYDFFQVFTPYIILKNILDHHDGIDINLLYQKVLDTKLPKHITTEEFKRYYRQSRFNNDLGFLIGRGKSEQDKYPVGRKEKGIYYIQNKSQAVKWISDMLVLVETFISDLKNIKTSNPIPSEYQFGSYRRVVPRDLFNEAKLLKCLGKIAIGILDGKLGEFELEEKFTNPENGFEIVQNDDGDIMCENYRVFKGDEELYLFTRLNSKANWPLMTIDHNAEYIDVMDDDGKFTNDFLTYLSEI
jgi:hypothetical protein